MFGQIHGLLDICERRALKPRFLIASMRNSGHRTYATRLDFSFIRDRVHAGQCSLVAYYKVDRIARSVLAANLFYQFLQDTHTGLFLEELGREVDWDNESDMLMLNTLGSIGQFEGARIKARTHDPFKRRWVLTGRGWPAAKRVGFKRDAGQWLVVDPLQWPHIKFAHMEFANSGSHGGTSIRNLRDILEERGFKISRDKLRVLLHDRIYVDGEWTFNYEGVEYTGRTIEIPDPVPQEVFDRNQRLLKLTGGKQRVNPIGHYLLNRVLLTHSTCRHLVDENGRPPVLRGRRGSYLHRKCPHQECRGFSVSHPALDALVVSALLKLCESKDLQAEYEQRADRAITGEYDDAGRTETLRNRLTILKHQEARIKREWLEEGIEAGRLDPAIRAEALADIRADIHACTRQVEYAEIKERRAAERAMLGEQADDLLARARQILTPTAPADPDLAQRRIAFVDRALSEVEVGTGHVTLYGPLIPEGGVRISGNPLEHTADILGDTTDFEANACKSVVSRRRGRIRELDVAWKSGPLALPPRRPCSDPEPWALDWESCLDALRSVHALEPPGYLSKQAVAHSWASSGGDGRRLAWSLRSHGTAISDVWIAAIGEEASLLVCRRWCSSERDVRRAIQSALDAGVRFGVGWWARWNTFAEGARWVGRADLMARRVARLGLDLDELIAAELVERGAPPAFMSGPRRRVDDRPGMVRETLLAADKRLEMGQRLTTESVDRAVASEAWPDVGREVQEECRRLGLSWEQAVREFLGAQHAVLRGRVVARGTEDWRLIVRGALSRGLKADARWREHWAAVQAKGWWLPGLRTFARAVGGLPSAFAMIHCVRWWFSPHIG